MLGVGDDQGGLVAQQHARGDLREAQLGGQREGPAQPDELKRRPRGEDVEDMVGAGGYSIAGGARGEVCESEEELGSPWQRKTHRGRADEQRCADAKLQRGRGGVGGAERAGGAMGAGGRAAVAGPRLSALDIDAQHAPRLETNLRVQLAAVREG